MEQSKTDTSTIGGNLTPFWFIALNIYLFHTGSQEYTLERSPHTIHSLRHMLTVGA